MIKFANIDLLEASESLREWVRTNIDPADLPPYTTHWWPGKNLSHLPFRPPAPPRRIELNTLWWPTGASRFAVGWYLVDEGLLTQIRDVTEPLGSSHQPANLVLDDGTDSVTVSMWMLPAIPLQQIGADGLYLLPLVDERYFWWFKAETVVASTWANLYADFAVALGITLTVDAVELTYLSPHDTLGAQYEPLPLLLDATAYSTGRRVVRQLDGTARVWKPANALTQQATSLAAVEDKLAGGTMAFGADGADTLASVPGSVTMTCFVINSDTLHTEVRTLTSLSLAEYGTHQGHQGTKVVRTSEVLYPGDPVSVLKIAALATRIATDYYRWQAAAASLSIVGYPSWTLTGLEDAIELRHESGRIFTRVLRAAFDLDTAELLYDSPANPPAINDLDVMEDDGDPIVYQTTTLQFHAPSFIVTEITAHTALVEPHWGEDADVQPVGTENSAGTSELFAPIDHVHAAQTGCKTVRSILGPPPWTAPDDVCCNEEFFDGTYYGIYSCDTNLFVYFCPCEPDRPGSGSWSGSGSGSQGGPVCDCPQCVGGMPNWCTFTVFGATGDMEAANTTWRLMYSPIRGLCTWDEVIPHDEPGGVTATLKYDLEATEPGWTLKFANGTTGTQSNYVLRDVFRCCGENTFVYFSPAPPSEEGSIGDNEITIRPDGPCTPCGDGSGSGSGSGGGGGISTACCPGRAMPASLYATAVNGTGDCVCMNGTSVELAAQYSLGVFIGYDGAYAGCSGPNARLHLNCTFGGWRLDYYKLDGSSSDNTAGCCQGPGGIPHASAPTSVNCSEDDFELVFPCDGFPPPGGCCIGGWDWVITEL